VQEAEAQLTSALAARQAQVTHVFGELTSSVQGSSDDLYGAIKERRYQIDWTKAPRLLRIKIDVLRAVKNKLPRGRCGVLMGDGDPLRLFLGAHVCVCV
jgi:hypothetical protein